MSHNLSQSKNSEHAARLLNLQRIEFLAEDWQPMPAWIESLVWLGSTIGREPSEGGQLVVAVSLPTRSLAAVVCAVGVVVAAARKASDVDLDKHLECLKALPTGSMVSYRPQSGTRQGVGRYLGFLHEDGRDYIRIEERNSSIHRFPLTMANRVVPITENRGRVPKRRRPRPILENLDILEELVGSDGLSNVLERNEAACLIMGNRSFLMHELSTQEIRITTASGRHFAASLQDILCVDSKADRPMLNLCAVASSQARIPPSAGPPVVIFDGARSFVRWGSTWPNAHRVVVLDRTERGFDEATQMIDGMYLDRKDDGAQVIDRDPATGIQVAAFTMVGGRQ